MYLLYVVMRLFRNVQYNNFNLRVSSKSAINTTLFRTGTHKSEYEWNKSKSNKEKLVAVFAPSFQLEPGPEPDFKGLSNVFVARVIWEYSIGLLLMNYTIRNEKKSGLLWISPKCRRFESLQIRSVLPTGKFWIFEEKIMWLFRSTLPAQIGKNKINENLSEMAAISSKIIMIIAKKMKFDNLKLAFIFIVQSSAARTKCSSILHQ